MKEKLILSDSAFFWNKKDEAMIYDADRKRRILIDKRESQSVMSICEDLDRADSLMTIVIDRSSLDTSGQKLVDSIIENGLGRVVNGNAKDCAIPPRPVITNDLDYCSGDSLKDAVSNMDVLSYLRCVIFYMGGKCHDNDICRQVPYPINSDDELPCRQVLKVIEESYSNAAVRYKLILSYIERCKLETLAQMLIPYKEKVTFVVIGGTEEEYVNLLLNRGFGVECILDPKFMVPSLYSDERIQYQLIVRNEEDLELLKIGDGITFVPVYDCNEDFIVREYLLSELEVKNTDPSRRLIFIHQKINLNYWGQIYVSPKGEIFSSPMMDSCLGFIEEPLTTIIGNEFIRNYNWRRVRNNPTCSQCVFQWLCPNPTPIETFMNMNTICKKAVKASVK